MTEIESEANDNIVNNEHITITALRCETRNLLASLLNPAKYIPSPKGLQRDWHGLAELCGIGGERIPDFQRRSDPTNNVLEFWVKHNFSESSIGNLLLFLEDLDRFDIVYEITPLIEKDIVYFKKNPDGFKGVTSFTDENDSLTREDVDRKSKGLLPQIYDAFVLYAQEDIAFATELINTMENQYNLKLCVTDRDLLGGSPKNETIIKLISKRCHRIVVIVTPAFFESQTLKYYYEFARSIGIEQQGRKIIPCLIQPCANVPEDFNMMVCLDYKRIQKFCIFWEKLYDSIKISETRSLGQSTPVLKRSMETLKPKNHVKFNSVDNLNVEGDPPNTTMTMSLTDSLKNDESTPSEPLKKKNSFYKRLKKIINPKTVKNTDEIQENEKSSDVAVKKSEKKKFTIRKNCKTKVALPV